MTEDQMAAVHDRLAELQSYVDEDGEEPMNEASLAAMLAFCERARATNRPMISMDDQGILHANWISDSLRLILVFRPDGTVSIVARGGGDYVCGQIPAAPPSA